jgi:two-component sensor histidine kinase
MNMTLDAQTLSSLFDVSRDAVMGIENDIIVFANPAAHTLLGASQGLGTASFFPKNVLDALTEPGPRFVTAASIKGHSGTLSVLHQEDLTILTFVPQDDTASASHRPLLRHFADNLFTLRLAVDGVMKDIPTEDDPKLRRYANVAYQCYYKLNRLYQHISLLDDLTNDPPPHPDRLVDAEQVCDELYRTVEPLMRSTGIAMHYHAGQGAFLTLVDRGHLETLVLNLLSNSFAHTTPGSCITLGLSRMADRILLSVDDLGSGIEPDVLACLFSQIPMLKTTDISAGAGLGLILVRRIAEYYGGAVMLESKPGKGTSVRVSLPVRLPQDALAHNPSFTYRADGMNTVLTELSVVLKREWYDQKMFD